MPGSYQNESLGGEFMLSPFGNSGHSRDPWMLLTGRPLCATMRLRRGGITAELLRLSVKHKGGRFKNDFSMWWIENCYRSKHQWKGGRDRAYSRKLLRLRRAGSDGQ